MTKRQFVLHTQQELLGICKWKFWLVTCDPVKIKRVRSQSSGGRNGDRSRRWPGLQLKRNVAPIANKTMGREAQAESCREIVVSIKLSSSRHLEDTVAAAERPLIPW